MTQGLETEVDDRQGFSKQDAEGSEDVQDARAAEDEAILARIVDGEEGAFAELVRRHSQRFYRIAYRFSASREDAQDIVQEAFLRLWQRPHLFKANRKTRFTTWFYRVVINLCIDYNRRPKTSALTDDMDIPGTGIAQDAAIDNRERQAYLERAISELPLRQRMALNLCFYEGVSNKDAAAIIGVSLKALQSLLMRAKLALKEKMASHYGGVK
ncbi:MAG: sigma-70 family RNA polymerase sigma factor [Nitrospirae bacterium]|nr:sigma-70 family RNA polymerase sigma factor [Nitrospirota bacterium]MBF0591167.1 sigma-70 family RNA polymerase sigma factor [Nitrospirota bacterium]